MHLRLYDFDELYKKYDSKLEKFKANLKNGFKNFQVQDVTRSV